MKRTLWTTLILLILLTACAPAEPELAPGFPEASSTPPPSAIEPTAATRVSLTPQDSSAASAVIILGQEGGIAGVQNEWTIYGDGRIVTNNGDELMVEPEEVTALLETIEQAGFFDLEQPEAADICCDFFTFTLTIKSGELEKRIVMSEGDPSIPQALSETLAAVQELILSASG